jgi:biotin operon repressor
MSLLKYIGRLKFMHDLISKESTGGPEEFARKLSISRAMLMNNLKDFKELGADIRFCRYKRSYYYTKDFTILIEGKTQFEKIKGGGIVRSNHIRSLIFKFV